MIISDYKIQTTNNAKVRWQVAEMLAYENEMFLSALQEDGITIAAKGLGLERVFLSMVKVMMIVMMMVMMMMTLTAMIRSTATLATWCWCSAARTRRRPGSSGRWSSRCEACA